MSTAVHNTPRPKPKASTLAAKRRLVRARSNARWTNPNFTSSRPSSAVAVSASSEAHGTLLELLPRKLRRRTATRRIRQTRHTPLPATRSAAHSPPPTSSCRFAISFAGPLSLNIRIVRDRSRTRQSRRPPWPSALNVIGLVAVVSLKIAEVLRRVLTLIGQWCDRNVLRYHYNFTLQESS